VASRLSGELTSPRRPAGVLFLDEPPKNKGEDDGTLLEGGFPLGVVVRWFLCED
jgi:hypothetical protein